MQITTAANIGDEIFFLADNKVKTSIIRHIKIEIIEEYSQFGTKNKVLILYYTSDENTIYEHNAFLTKQELLDSL